MTTPENDRMHIRLDVTGDQTIRIHALSHASLFHDRGLKSLNNTSVVELLATANAFEAYITEGGLPGGDPEMLREMASRLLTAANEAEAVR